MLGVMVGNVFIDVAVNELLGTSLLAAAVRQETQRVQCISQIRIQDPSKPIWGL